MSKKLNKANQSNPILIPKSCHQFSAFFEKQL